VSPLHRGRRRSRAGAHRPTLRGAAVGTGLLAATALAGCEVDSFAEPVRFAAYRPELFASGGALTDAWADIDGDGDPDRFVGFDGAPSRLYRNDLLDGFEDVAGVLGIDVERSVRTAAWGDFDADGDPDLFLGFAGESPVSALYRNDGRQGFVDVAGDLGVEIEEGTPRQASWIDADEDGDLDLFLAMRDRANRFYENGGSDGFTDIADLIGLADERRSVGAAWFDRGDGRLDLVVANMNGDANGFFVQGPDGFREAGLEAVRSGGRTLGSEEEGSVRPCVVDYDADGDFDLFFANYGANGLLERRPDGEMVDVAEERGVANPSRYDTCAWGDFDHDGRVDLYVNGTVGGGVHYRDWLLRREGGERFIDVTPPELRDLGASHGATWVDFDLDGDLDLALAGAAPDGMHHLMQNLLRPEVSWHSLRIRVLDARGRATRPGAEVRVYAAGSTTLIGSRIVDTGSGYDAQSDLPVHIGIPGGQPVDVEVTILAGGERRSGVVRSIDPADHLRRQLTIRIGDDGTIIR